MTAAGREYDVLVVDDDFMVARIHTRYLATVDGFHVVDTVHTGTQALAALERHHPDLMLLDVYLPDMTGIDVLRRARQDFPDVEIAYQHRVAPILYSKLKRGEMPRVPRVALLALSRAYLATAARNAVMWPRKRESSSPAR